MRATALLPVALLAVASCSSTPSALLTAEPRDAELRSRLLTAIQSLEGRWEMPGGEAPAIIEFRSTAAGSAVCEVMFPGTENEMVNLYTLDGNSLVMTHYCAAGNQPRMRATDLVDGRLEFVSVSVSDLETPGALHMADMTLVLVDEDRIEQHWRAVKDGEDDHMPVFELVRVR